MTKTARFVNLKLAITYYRRLEKLRAKVTAVIPANTPTVLIKSETASFFFPSKNSSIGCDKNRYPITAADKVNSDNIATGMTKLSGPLVSLVPKLITVTTRAM